MGIGRFELIWEGGIRKALPADGARETGDGAGAHRRAATIGSGWIGTTVHDGVTDFHSGGEAIDDHAPGLLSEDVEEIGGSGNVVFGSMDGRGQLTFETGGRVEEVVVVFIFHDEGSRAEDLVAEGGVGDELIMRRLEDRRSGLAVAFNGFDFGEGFESGLGFERLNAFGVVRADALVEHGGGGHLAEPERKSLAEYVRLRREDKARAGAELAGSDGDGADEVLGNVFTPLRHGTGKDEDGVDGTHLGINWNGFMTGGSEVHEGAASGTGAGEADCFDGRILHELGSQRDAIVEDHRESSFGKATGNDGLLDGSGDEFGGLGVGRVGPYDDGATRREGAGGVATSHRESEGKVGSAKDRNGAARTLHGADVRLGHGRTVRQGRVDTGPDPIPIFDESGKESELSAGPSKLHAATGLGQGALGGHAGLDFISKGLDVLSDGAKKFCAFRRAGERVGEEGLGRKSEGLVDLVFGRGVVGRFDGRIGGRVDRVEGLARIAAAGMSDKRVSGKCHHERSLEANPELKRVERVKNEGGLSRDVSRAGHDGGDSSVFREGLKGSFEDRANDGGLSPNLACGQFPGSGEAGELGAGAGSAWGSVVGFAGTEHEVLAVGVDPVGRRSEDLDVVDMLVVGPGDVLFFKSLSNGPSEGGELLDVFEADFGTLVGDEEEPVASPGNVASDGAVACHFDRAIGGVTVGGDVLDGDQSCVRKGGGDDADGSLNTVISSGDSFEVGEGLDETDRAMKAAVERGDVVKKDHAGDAGGVGGFAQVGPDHRVEATGLINQGGAEPVGFACQKFAGGEGSGDRGDGCSANHDARGFASGVGVDDLDSYYLIRHGRTSCFFHPNWPTSCGRGRAGCAGIAFGKARVDRRN